MLAQRSPLGNRASRKGKWNLSVLNGLSQFTGDPHHGRLLNRARLTIRTARDHRRHMDKLTTESDYCRPGQLHLDWIRTYIRPIPMPFQELIGTAIVTRRFQITRRVTNVSTRHATWQLLIAPRTAHLLLAVTGN